MSSTTTNLGLVKMASGETIGQWSDANNGSGQNLDKIDTAIGTLNSQIALKASIIVSGGFNVYRSGGTVFASCLGGSSYSCDSAGGAVKFNGTAITIPSGYRPLFGADVRDTFGNKRIGFATDGTITCTEAFTSGVIRFTTAWVTDDSYPT